MIQNDVYMALALPINNPAAVADLSEDEVAAIRIEQQHLKPQSYHELKAENIQLRQDLDALRKQYEEANERATNNIALRRRQDDIHVTLLRAAHEEAINARNEAWSEAAELRQQLQTANEGLAALRQQLSRHNLAVATEAAYSAATLPPRSSEFDEEGQAEGGSGGGGGGSKDDAAAAAAAPKPPPVVDGSILREWSGYSETEKRRQEQDAARLERLEALAASVTQSYEFLQLEHTALKRRYQRLARQKEHEAARGRAGSESD